MHIDGTTTVREIALGIPAATGVFQTLGIDFCCGGGKPLAEACQAAGRTLDEVLGALRQADRGEAPQVDWSARTLRELVAHILERHHAYLRSELPRILALADKVAGKHGDNHPELQEIRQAARALAGELDSHMMKEERILFPFVEQLEASSGGGAIPGACLGSCEGPIRVMLAEHDDAGGLLRRLRAASSDYAAPADACTSYRVLYQSLEELERDLHEHIHLENNILFPRALDLEQRVTA